MKKDHTLFGLKIYNYDKKEIGLLIYTWTNTYSVNGGGTEDVPFATCVDKKGNSYNTAMENIIPFETLDEEDLAELNLV